MNDRSAPDRPSPPDSSRSVGEAVAAWAKALSDVGGPNTLLWAPERPGGYLDLTTAHPGGVSMLLAGRVTHLSDLVREPAALTDALEVLRQIHARSRRLERERGLVAAFVAVGMATWDPPRPGAPIASPVLLRGCRLRPTSSAEDDFQVDLARSVEVNPVLVNYLRVVAGVAVDPVGLADLTRVASSFDPYPVYAVLGRACADIPGFQITPKLVVGTYPYAKLPMVADLTANTEWLAQVDVVAGLAGERAAQERLRATLPDVVPDPDPHRELLVLDADATQGSIVEAVRSGTQLVVEAPHGTGATQTVANTIAALAHDGKRTLLVTPSRPTIIELRERLDAVGLGDLVFDLTAAATDRHTAAADLGRKLSSVRELDDDALRKAADPPGRAGRERTIVELRGGLIDHMESVHEVRAPWGVSVHDIQSAMAALAATKPAPASRIRLRGSAIRSLTRERVEELAVDLRAAAEAGAWSDDPAGDPWYGASIASEAEVAQARQIVTRLAGDGLRQPAQTLDEILAESALPPAVCPDDWRTALRTMRGVRDTLEVFRPEVFDVPLDEHVVATGPRAFRATQDVKLGWLARSRVRRQARRMLRPGRPPADLHAELVSARDQRQNWHRLVGAGGRPELSPRLEEAEQTYAGIGEDLAWLGAHLSETHEGGDLTRLSLPRLRGRINKLAARIDRLEVLPRVSSVLAELREAGMGDVLDDFARRSVAADAVRAELEHIWWASVSLDVADADPRCRDHDGRALHEAAERYRALDREHRDETAAIVRARVDLRARGRLGTHPKQAELLAGQASGERWLLPFHDVFRECEDVVSALHPCLAMSPYAVAQLLPPGASFDLVVVQDASSVATAEVVSALSRGRQALVVGDPHGAGPSAFSVAPTGPVNGTAPEPQTPSLLVEAASLLPRRALDWRHGAVDVRLTAWCTPDGALIGTPGSAVEPLIRFDRVDGSAHVAAGDESAIEWTQAEVDRIVALAMDHARRDPHRSLAVVALTPALAGQVEATVRSQLHALASHDRTDPALAFFVETRHEPFVVEALDCARAERDRVILGVGYGRTPHGRVLHRFPSLAGDEAMHRLSRVAGLARHGVHVVSSLSADDLDPDRLRTPGAQALRALLARAEQLSGSVDTEPVDPDALPVPDPLLDDLAARLAQEGMTLRRRIGAGAHPVDLAVGHPSVGDRSLVAVETDGTGYAALVGARGRERLRVEQLERLGWRPVRVWTTDLYRDPAREVARITAAVREARRSASPGERPEVEATGEEPGSGQPEQAATDDEHETALDMVGARASSGSPAGTGGGTSRRRRRRLRRGTAQQSVEDTDRGWGEVSDGAAGDRWLEEQRPPHWE